MRASATAQSGQPPSGHFSQIASLMHLTQFSIKQVTPYHFDRELEQLRGAQGAATRPLTSGGKGGQGDMVRGKGATGGTLRTGGNQAARVIRVIPPAAIKEVGVREKATASRKAKTVTIRLTDVEEKNITAKANPLQLIKAFRVKKEPLIKQIIATRKL